MTNGEFYRFHNMTPFEQDVLTELRAIRALLEKQQPAYETKIAQARCGEVKTKDAPASEFPYEEIQTK